MEEASRICRRGHLFLITVSELGSRDRNQLALAICGQGSFQQEGFFSYWNVAPGYVLSAADDPFHLQPSLAELEVETAKCIRVLVWRPLAPNISQNNNLQQDTIKTSQNEIGSWMKTFVFMKISSPAIFCVSRWCQELSSGRVQRCLQAIAGAASFWSSPDRTCGGRQVKHRVVLRNFWLNEQRFRLECCFNSNKIISIVLTCHHWDSSSVPTLVLHHRCSGGRRKRWDGQSGGSAFAGQGSN